MSKAPWNSAAAGHPKDREGGTLVERTVERKSSRPRNMGMTSTFSRARESLAGIGRGRGPGQFGFDIMLEELGNFGKPEGVGDKEPVFPLASEDFQTCVLPHEGCFSASWNLLGHVC